jgi:transposase
LWLHFYHLGGSGQELEAQRPPDEVAVESGIEPLVKFAKALEQRLEGILAHCRYPLHTSVIERINNKIKVLKRMAYGFRDDEYFFLRIRAAFPGIP